MKGCTFMNFSNTLTKEQGQGIKPELEEFQVKS